MAAFSSHTTQAVLLKFLYFVLTCYCIYSAARVLPTEESLFVKHTTVFNIKSPMYMQNINAKKVLSLLEETFQEVLEEINNEKTDFTEERKYRQRRFIPSFSMNMLSSNDNKEINLEVDRVKAIISREPTEEA
uniref:Uncharacterized protein n=1 Tax=Setaria digitata TaxID=48799 RepID=A0A915Q1J9_9BILA